METLLWTLLCRAAESPTLAAVILGTFLLASLVRNVIVAVWPEFVSRPTWARIVMVLAEPLALNLPKALAMRLNPAPVPDLPVKALSPADVAAAIKRQN